jgi:hypothetical protein
LKAALIFGNNACKYAGSTASGTTACRSSVLAEPPLAAAAGALAAAFATPDGAFGNGEPRSAFEALSRTLSDGTYDDHQKATRCICLKRAPGAWLDSLIYLG